MKVTCVHRLSSIGEKKISSPKYFNRFQLVCQESVQIVSDTHAVKSYQLLYTSWMAAASTDFYLKTLASGENR